MLADAIRFAFQKHQRAIRASIAHAAERSSSSECALSHAERMFIAAAIELAESIEEEIDRRIAARSTFFQGGRL